MRRALAILGMVLSTGCSHREPTYPEAVRPEPAAAPSPATATPASPAAPAGPSAAPAYQAGLATWYGGKLAGHRTASGERFDPAQMTAAHRTLPFGTLVEVTRADTGRSVVVRINDRGPFGDGARIIDLSRGAAEKIGLVRVGVTRVTLRVVD
jgi:peptidoglycan lytic transglycosylase